MVIIVYDIETIKGCFLLSAYMPSTGEWIDFLIHKGRNDIDSMIKWLEKNKDKMWVGFNNLSFDGQVVEWIYRTYGEWHDLDGGQIAEKIWEKSQRVIDDSNYGLYPQYNERDLSFKQLDVFRVQHFDNKNRMVGLKRLEYEMDMENIEDMKVSHGKEAFTDKEIEDLIYYCHNDVQATYLNYQYIRGNTDNIIYKDNDQIEIREALKETFGFNCLNWSNSKYGDEIIKTLYCKEANIDYGKLPRQGTFRKSIRLGDCIPSFIQFQSKELQDFHKSLKKKTLAIAEEFKELIEFRGQTYTFARGGIHNVIENKRYDSDTEYIIRDVDVSAYYVKTILNNKLAPAHLKSDAFCKAYQWIYDERMRLKPLSKKDKKIKGVVSGYKEAGVSVYGKSGDVQNWLYDMKMMLHTCIAGELSILMLIESQELAGYPCIMANTDGATFYVKRTEVDKFDKICKDWMALTDYELEFFNFKKLYFLTVNDYIGEWDGYVDPIMGKVKRKGDFLTDSELHKNKAFRVIPLALYEYFINDKSPKEFIDNFDNIFHFCGRSSAGKVYRHEIIGKNIILPRLIRYYVAKKGDKIKKIVREGNLTGANNTNLRPAELPKAICNNLPKSVHTEHLSNINRGWYTDEVNKLIFRIERGRKPKGGKPPNPNQTSLF